MSIIYLFANQKYGKHFIETACAFRNKQKIDIRLILSGKGWRHSSGLIGRLKYTIKAKQTEVPLAKKYGMPVTVVADINDPSFGRRIKRGNIGIVAGFNQIFKRSLIDRFKSVVNFHPSLLPYYRGPVPSYWCLKNGEINTGFTLHEIVESIDAGKILYQDVVSIPTGIDTESLDMMISQKASTVLNEYLAAITNGKDFVPRKIDAKQYYSNLPDYLSFPQL